MSKICQYCGNEEEADEKRCAGCDTVSFGEQLAQQRYEGNPFPYNGYVVWWIRDIISMPLQTVEYLFYLGDQLVERIILDRDIIKRFVPEHGDVMPFIWDLFKLAQGEEEVLRITEQNAVKPVIFEITVKHSPAEEWAIGLTRNDVYHAVAEGRRELTYHA